MPFSHLFLCCPLLLLLSIFSSIRVFSDELALCIRWPKYCSFSISPSNEYSGLISFRMDLSPCCQGTFKNLLQHHKLESINSLVLSLLYGPTLTTVGLPWLLGWSRIYLQCGRPGYDPWVRKIPCRSEWQYSCLENSMDTGAWRATVHRVTRVGHD